MASELAEEKSGGGSALRAARSDIAALLALLLFALAVLWPVLLGKVPVASDTLALWAPWSQVTHPPIRNLTLADSALLYLPWEMFSREAVRAGEWPLWDPYTFSGFPFAANPQNGIYYPLIWLLWLLPLSGAIQVRAIFNIVLAGWGMYLFGRALSASRVGSLVGGLAFAGSGMLQTGIEIPGVASAYGWLPWLLLTGEQALRLKSWRWTAAACLCCGLQIVSGHPQWSVYALFALGCWLLFRSLQRWAGTLRRPREPGSPTAWLDLVGSLGRSALIMGSGPVLAMVHIAPFLELMGQAGRAGVRVSSSSDPLLYLFRTLLPNFFGTPLAVPGFPLGSSNLWYVGIAPAALSVAAILAGPRAVSLFWAGLALFAVCVIYGVGPFLYVRWLPGLQSTVPVRISFLIVASLAVLSALGYDALLALAKRRPLFAGGVAAAAGAALVLPLAAALFGRWTRSPWTMTGLPPESEAAMRAVQAHDLVRGIIFAGLTLLLVGTLALRGRRFERPRLAAGALLVVVLAADLLTCLPDFNSFVSPEEVRPSTAGIRWLRQQPGEWRLLGYQPPGATAVFVPNTQLLFSLPSVQGYDSLHPRRYDEFWAMADPSIRPGGPTNVYSNVFVRPQAYTSTLASLLGVRYVASAVALGDSGLPGVYKGEFRVYENPNALPKAFLLERAEMLPAAEVLSRLGSPDFDPLATVLIEGAQGEIPGQGVSPAPVPVRPPGSASITAYRRNSVELSATVTQASWLVLADSYYPGWHVSVDGREQTLYIADHILRAVRLEPGKHAVRFWFLPSLFAPTAIVSAAALLLVVVGLAWRRRA